MDEMYKVYQSSHIALVPTMWAEGTSLSCIEAMSSNNAIISTNIGGLPNLVIDGFNGCLINPDMEDLVSSIDLLLQNRSKMQEMASNGILMSKSFGKKQWVNKWNNIINKVIQ
jgi:glycosyltransferase involved in cell wall biosynthesis